MTLEKEISADVVVVGGGLGGVAATLAMARLGLRVVMTEGTSVLGGQLTAQGVPPDEHPWIETRLGSPSYRNLRQLVRAYYQRSYPLSEQARKDPTLNPGLGYVSRLCAEPRVFAAAIDELLAPHVAAGRVTVLRRYHPTSATCDGDRVTSVLVTHVEQGATVVLCAPLFVDATELGDLLELAGVEHVFGAEGQSSTGELHAPQAPNPLDQQAISWCFAVEHREGEDHRIDRPSTFDYWSTKVAPFWPGPQLSWTDVVPADLSTRTHSLFGVGAHATEVHDLWRFRRILASELFHPGTIEHDVSLVNWPQIDYWERPLLGNGSPDDTAAALAGARELSLSFLYWMQTEAPRPDGGVGYPGLRPRGDILGSEDQLAIAPYIRESRRIVAAFTVTEGHIGRLMRKGAAGAEVFGDSVGIGSYRIDLHPSTSGRTYVDIAAFPFQIPLGALVPVRVTNLLPANKNIGTTHITNGAYRLHPVEWSIGEAVGVLVFHCIRTGLTPAAVHQNPKATHEVQRILSNRFGVALAWPDAIRNATNEFDMIADVFHGTAGEVT